MLELKDFMPVNYLKKENFTGSYRGMRFRMERRQSEGEEESLLGVIAWPEPYGYDATPKEQMEQASFPFTADGIAAGVVWLNEQYKTRFQTSV